MNLIEFRAPDKAEKLGAIIEKHFSKHFKDKDVSGFLSQGHAYVSDRPRKHAHFTVKPKSKIVLIGKFGLEDSRISAKDIVFENKQIVIWNKPSGLSTQGTLKKHEANLFDQVRLHYVLDKNFPGGLPYVGLHHRLDRDTSGLVLMTKQRSANKDVADLFKNRRIEKNILLFVNTVTRFPKKSGDLKA